MADYAVRAGAIQNLVHGPGARRDLRARADRVVGLAKTYVPVRYGYLRSTIRRDEPFPSGPTRLTCRVRAGAVYAAAIHDGRGSRYAPPSWRRRGPGAQPFLANALTAAEGTVRRR
jgi:hypothetical protein